jgi:hypothetical protein
MINTRLLAEVMGTTEREAEIILAVQILTSTAQGLLELTNDGLHDILNVSEWDAVRLLAKGGE